MSQSVVEARRLVLMLYGVFCECLQRALQLVEGFDEDLSRGLWMLMNIIGRLLFVACI